MKAKRIGTAAALMVWAALLVNGVSYTPLTQVAPGPEMPAEVKCMGSNNNLDLARYQGRLFFAFRTAPTHFASSKTRLYIVSTADEKKWDYEAEVWLGYDMREPRFLVLGDKLMFYFFEAGKNPLSFTPQHIFAMERKGLRDWTKPVPVFQDKCVLWRAQVHEGKAYATVYCGEGEYRGKNATIAIYFLTTTDGYHFEPVDPKKPVVATGGSETAFAWDDQNHLYTVIRNEAGDGQTWGSKVCTAPPESPADWKCAITPNKYDSPLMFRHGADIYLIARRNIDGAYDKQDRWLWDPAEGLYYIARYWWTRKRTALYKLDTANLRFDPVLDFPSQGDTAFPALVPIDDNHYLMFNYSSPLEGRDRVWMMGQLTGTRIYKTIISFE